MKISDFPILSGWTQKYKPALSKSDSSWDILRKIINIYNNIAWKYGNVTVSDFRKHEKQEYKKSKLKLDIYFLNNCK